MVNFFNTNINRKLLKSSAVAPSKTPIAISLQSLPSSIFAFVNKRNLASDFNSKINIKTYGIVEPETSTISDNSSLHSLPFTIQKKTNKLNKKQPLLALNEDFFEFVKNRHIETNENLNHSNIKARQHNIFQAFRHNTQTQQEKLNPSITEKIKKYVPFITLSNQKKQDNQGRYSATRAFCHNPSKINEASSRWLSIKRAILTGFAFDDTPDKDLISNYHTMRDGWWVAGTSAQLDIWGSHLSTSHIGIVLNTALNITPIVGPLIALASSALGLVIDGRLQMNVNIAQDTLANGIIARLSNHATNPKKLAEISEKINKISLENIHLLNILNHELKNNPHDLEKNNKFQELLSLVLHQVNQALSINNSSSNSTHEASNLIIKENLLSQNYNKDIINIILNSNDIESINQQYSIWFAQTNPQANLKQQEEKYSSFVQEKISFINNKFLNIQNNYERDVRGHVNNFREVKLPHAYQNTGRILAAVGHTAAWSAGMPILSVPIIMAKGLFQLSTSGFDEVRRYLFRLGTVAKDGAKDLMHQDLVDNGFCYRNRDTNLLDWEKLLINHLTPTIKKNIKELEEILKDLPENTTNEQKIKNIKYKLKKLVSLEKLNINTYYHDLLVNSNENIWDINDYNKFLLLKDKKKYLKDISQDYKEVSNEIEILKQKISLSSEMKKQKLKNAKDNLNNVSLSIYTTLLKKEISNDITNEKPLPLLPSEIENSTNHKFILSELLEEKNYLENYISLLKTQSNNKSNNTFLNNFLSTKNLKNELVITQKKLSIVSANINKLQQAEIEYSRLCINYTSPSLRRIQDSLAELSINKTKVANHFKSKTKVREEQCNKVIERRLVHQVDKVKAINHEILSYITNNNISLEIYNQVINSKSMHNLEQLVSAELNKNSLQKNEKQINNICKVIRDLIKNKNMEAHTLQIMQKDLEHLKLSFMAAEAQENSEGKYILIDSKGDKHILSKENIEDLKNGYKNITPKNQWMKKLFTNTLFFHWHTSQADSSKPGELLSQYIYRFNNIAFRFSTALAGLGIASAHNLNEGINNTNSYDNTNTINPSNTPNNNDYLHPNVIDPNTSDNVIRMISQGIGTTGILAFIIFGIWQLKYNKTYMLNNPDIAKLIQEKLNNLQKKYSTYSDNSNLENDMQVLLKLIELKNQKQNITFNDSENNLIQQVNSFLLLLNKHDKDTLKTIGNLFTLKSVELDNEHSLNTCTLPDEINVKTKIQGSTQDINIFTASTANTGYKLADITGRKGQLRRTRATFSLLPKHSYTIFKEAITSTIKYPKQTYNLYKNYHKNKKQNKLGIFTEIFKSVANSLTLSQNTRTIHSFTAI